jgi:hypothetical protein
MGFPLRFSCPTFANPSHAKCPALPAWIGCEDRHIVPVPANVSASNSLEASLDKPNAEKKRDLASKKYWEVAPTVCWVKPLGHAKIQCKTDDEFEELVDRYFGIGP